MKSWIKTVVVIGAFAASNYGTAFAQSAPAAASSAPKSPPTYEQLTHQNKVLAVMLQQYYQRATAAEAQLLQLQAEQQVSTQEAGASPTKK